MPRDNLAGSSSRCLAAREGLLLIRALCSLPFSLPWVISNLTLLTRTDFSFQLPIETENAGDWMPVSPTCGKLM